ncbi:MAG: hypothetical protein DRQ60_11370 [Gammaproteobacteria bacterium]|nr:MAG: hypothetical protein DRQ60_11370 [Gammaproteobacteria bacterium]
MTQVLIKQGTYGHGAKLRHIISQTFTLAKEYVEAANGNYVTVVGTKAAGLEDRNCRIKLESRNCIEYVTSDGDTLDTPHARTAEEEFAASETDEQAMARIAQTFEILNEITDASAQGIIRGMVVSGPPGIGKSYGVGKTLEKANFDRSIAGQPEKYEVITGAASAIGLYKRLYLNRAKGFVTVLDDCDSILFDEQSLNLLKAALDTTDKRKLFWLSESSALRKEEIPDMFEFEGSVIFLTNLDFEKTKASKLSAHLSAIMSRCHYVDLEISSLRDQLLRIKQVVNYGMLDSYALNYSEKQDVVDFVIDNAEWLREISLRMVIKVADLAEAYKKGALQQHWRDLAEMTCLKKEAKYERLLAKL